MEERLVVWLLVVSDLIVSGALGWTTWAAASGGLRVNAAAGIRTRATMVSEAAWVAGHRAAWPFARALTVLSVSCAVVAVVLLSSGLAGAGIVIGALPVVAVSIGAVPLVRLAGRAARAADGRSGIQP